MRAIDVELKDALGRGDPGAVARLIADGANVRYVDEHGYDALLAAAHGRDVARADGLLDVLRVLVENGVRLDTVTAYKESALRVLAHVGRFDAVRLLLDAGADRSQLEWTPLHEAVALGSLADVERALAAGADLEARDWWSRTPWLLAIAAGDRPKAELLGARGADLDPRARGDVTAVCEAIAGHRPDLVRWLLEMGHDPQLVNTYGMSPLLCAVDERDVECAKVLIGAGADVDQETQIGSVLGHADTVEIIECLLDAGADPRRLSSEGHRVLCGLSDGVEALARVSPAEFARARTRRFGRSNPERFAEPFWEAMIRCGVSAYEGASAFDAGSPHRVSPAWSAMRFGQSITFLPDGRIVRVAGEHEDSYDEDFCIYNDVFVHGPDGSIVIYGYPEDLFPPTDFHTATLMDDGIYLIGSLGYAGRRAYGTTPVFRIDLETLRIERLEVTGEAPGWIYGHRARDVTDTRILVTGGTIVTRKGANEELHEPNVQAFVLDVARLAWTRERPLPQEQR